MWIDPSISFYFCSLSGLTSSDFDLFPYRYFFNYRLCGLVVRVPGYRSRCSGFDSRRYRIFWEVVGMERGPVSPLAHWPLRSNSFYLVYFAVVANNRSIRCSIMTRSFLDYAVQQMLLGRTNHEKGNWWSMHQDAREQTGNTSIENFRQEP
jgi:hypothetical protein